MKLNYQRELNKIINSLVGVPTLLLHSCCAPCSSYVISYLSNYFKITVFYYNPNIMDKEEYQKRLKEQIRFIKAYKSKYPVTFIEGDYNPDQYCLLVKGLEQEKEGGPRCHKCYFLRLEQTANYAKDHLFDYFGTTLTVSPYKKAAIINDIGLILQEKYHIKYLLSDFKKNNGYLKSIELSKEYHIYRQDFCGCDYSKNNNFY